MTWLRNHLVRGAVLVALAGALAACEEGPMEEAGETVDESVDEAGDTVEDAAD